MGEVPGLVEESGEIVETKAALGDFEDGTGEETDHFVEEAVAGPSQAPAVVEGFVVGLAKGSLEVGGVSLVATLGGEGLEIVGPQGELHGVPKQEGVELAGKMPSKAGLEGGEDGLGGDVVAVGLTRRRKSGVEVGRDLAGLEHTNGGRELGIERWNPVERIHGQVVRGIKVCDLSERVNAGVGTT